MPLLHSSDAVALFPTSSFLASLLLLLTFLPVPDVVLFLYPKRSRLCCIQEMAAASVDGNCKHLACSLGPLGRACMQAPFPLLSLFSFCCFVVVGRAGGEEGRREVGKRRGENPKVSLCGLSLRIGVSSSSSMAKTHNMAEFTETTILLLQSQGELLEERSRRRSSIGGITFLPILG